MSQDIITVLASKHNVDKRIVQGIISSSFAFTVDRMQDETDTTAIMFRYIGKFKIKNKFKQYKQTNIKHVRNIA